MLATFQLFVHSSESIHQALLDNEVHHPNDQKQSRKRLIQNDGKEETNCCSTFLISFEL